jgi:hypothetical protein
VRPIARPRNREDNITSIVDVARRIEADPLAQAKNMTEGVLRSRDLARTFFFGPFHLIPAQRPLLAREKPLRLGSRALEMLIGVQFCMPNDKLLRSQQVARRMAGAAVAQAQREIGTAIPLRVLRDIRLEAARPEKVSTQLAGSGC